MKLTRRKINSLIQDERAATKEYRKLGLKSLSRDEGKHLRFLKKLKAKKRRY